MNKELFPRASFLGFDQMLQDLDYATRHSNDSYPPHNVVKSEDDQYQVQIAVAGFSSEDIDISVEQRSLTVTGEKPSPETPIEYIHQGISNRKFKRVFRLSEYVQVTGAELKDGILVINLKVILPEEKRPRKIAINQNYEEIEHHGNSIN